MHEIAEPPSGSSELALSHAWANGSITGHFTTRDGIAVEIVFRGSWTHGFGPDFSEAMIAWPSGQLETGAIEVHLRTGGWRDHGHHQDPAYNNVILHIVGIDDGSETRRADGKLVPVVAVGLDHAQTSDRGTDWSRVGGDVCAADLAASRPAGIVRALKLMGDARLATFTTAMEAELALAPPDQVLWAGILDVLGISENREPMRALSVLAPIADLERLLAPSENRFELATARLLGLAGYLPISPRDAESTGLPPEAIERIEAMWRAEQWPGDESLSPGVWRAARVRPSNHPVARIVAAAALVASCERGLGATLLAPLRDGNLTSGTIVELIEHGGGAIGHDRATVLLARVLIPLALAHAEINGDSELSEGAMRVWDSLPGSAHNQQTRAAQLQITGGPPLRGLGERGMQGLIQLHRTRCQPRRCFECPIAAMVVADA